MGHLFPHERDRLDADGWAQRLGLAPYVRVGREWVLNKRDDGSCVFLDENNRCRIHTTLGEQAKPLACRIFPYSIRPVDRGWRASLRFDCPSVTDSRGELIARHQSNVQSLADSMSHVPRGHCIRLQGWLRASRQEVDGLISRLVRWFDRKEVSVGMRFVIFARVACALHRARLKKVRGERFLELLDLLIEGFAAERDEAIPVASARQHAMARQFAFASTEHVSLGKLQGGPAKRWRKRAEQLRKAKSFLRGCGVVPPLPGFRFAVTFESVEKVQRARIDIARIDELLLRYVRARFAGQTIFGEGYYCWPVTSGLGALALSIVAVGWVARYVCAGEGRCELTYADVSRALRAVDRGVTRIRALGTIAERGRVAFLMENEGLFSLMASYWMVEDR